MRAVHNIVLGALGIMVVHAAHIDTCKQEREIHVVLTIGEQGVSAMKLIDWGGKECIGEPDPVKREKENVATSVTSQPYGNIDLVTVYTQKETDNGISYPSPSMLKLEWGAEWGRDIKEKDYRELLNEGKQGNRVLGIIGILKGICQFHDLESDDKEYFLAMMKETDLFNSPALQAMVSTLYRDDKPGLGSNPKERIYWLTRAAEGEYVSACSQLALLFLQEKDVNSGVKWLKKAAALGDANSMLLLASMYCHGICGLEKDREKAEKLTKEAALILHIDPEATWIRISSAPVTIDI